MRPLTRISFMLAIVVLGVPVLAAVGGAGFRITADSAVSNQTTSMSVVSASHPAITAPVLAAISVATTNLPSVKSTGTQKIEIQSNESPFESPWITFALAYSMIGAIITVIASLLRWLLPHFANYPKTGHTLAVHSRVAALNAFERGFQYVEYPLVVVGTIVELSILWTNAGDSVLHTTLLGLYGALWLMLVLVWQKHTVVGRVVTPRQLPVHGAVVRAIHTKNPQLHTTTVTDRSGRFSMKVHAGTYQISAGKHEHQPTGTSLATQADTPARISLVVTPDKPIERMSKSSDDESFPFAPLS